jgi:hypothetical protein
MPKQNVMQRIERQSCSFNYPSQMRCVLRFRLGMMLSSFDRFFGKESSKVNDSCNLKIEKTFKCFYCGKFDHKRKFCQKKLWDEKHK